MIFKFVIFGYEKKQYLQMMIKLRLTKKLVSLTSLIHMGNKLIYFPKDFLLNFIIV